ncbi:MAG: methyltransferase domain-containing protein [Bacteroidia bacterium]|nr:methyltransferase domain-containing protein [Bacteroidia bacterium]
MRLDLTDRSTNSPDISDYIIIPPGYEYSSKDEVHSILDPDTKARLSVFLKRHLDMQRSAEYEYLSPEQIRRFPFIDLPTYKNEIFSRQQDLGIVADFLKNSFSKDKTLLEIGGWNSWLTKHLQSKGIQVISADIFDDEFNGLGSRHFFESPGWLSVQTDIMKPVIYKTQFDAIVFNHCLQFVTRPQELVMEYMKLLKPGGIMLLIGLDFFSNSEDRAKITEAYQKECLEKHGFDLQFYPCKGYFDLKDFELFKSMGFTFKSYTFSMASTLKRLLNGDKSGILYWKQSLV